MDKEKIWLSSPHMSGNEQKYVQEAFDTNWVAPLGPNVIGFENDIQEYLDKGIHVAALSSGTAAIHLGLIMLDVGPGDEVICQSFTFSASANPIAYLGAIPVFVDSENDTWNICPQYLESAIIDRIKLGKKPKAIIVVHLYGMPAKMNELLDISKKYSIPILEDAAEALGSKINNQHCGSFGEIACLSFNGNKIITTSGGGALISRERSYVDKAIFLATQARDQAPHYEHSHIGYNYRMSNICAGIGRGQMKVLESRIQKRRLNYEYYKSALQENKHISFLNELPGYYSNRWLSCILIDSDSGFSSENIRIALNKINIESRPLWKPMHQQPVFEKFPFYGSSISSQLFNKGLCLPSGSNLSFEQLDRVIYEILQTIKLL